MTLFRKLLASTLLIFYVFRSWDLELFFSDQGIAPRSVLSVLMVTDFRYSLLNVFPSTGALWFFHGAFLICLLSILAGFWVRGAAIVGTVLHLSFLHRNLGGCYGVDLIATFFLLYFCAADFRRVQPARPDRRALLGSVAFRLCQIQVCIIYAYSGMHKLKGVNWWRGDAIWYTVANFQMTSLDFSWLAHFPLLVAVATFSTLLWELYFPVLIWVKPVKYPLMIFGVFLHLGIAITLNIPFFGALMVCTYSLFLEEDLASRVSSFLTWSPQKPRVLAH
jgi:hypothetical protein